MVVVWLSGNVVGHINEVTLRRAGLMRRWVTVRGVYRLRVQPRHPGQLSLVIPPWVDEIRDGHGSGRPAGRVGSQVRFKANLAGRVRSGRNFLNALFLSVSRVK